MNTEIELHDSRVSEIRKSDSTVIVRFLPAYLHKSEGRPGSDSGTGWVQEVLLIFADASVSGDFPDWPCSLMGGDLVVNGERHTNSIPVPLEVTGLAELRLICDLTHTVTVESKGVKVQLVGEPRFVEEFKPSRTAI